MLGAMSGQGQASRARRFPLRPTAIGAGLGFVVALSMQAELDGFGHELAWLPAPGLAGVGGACGLVYGYVAKHETRPTPWPAWALLALATVGFVLAHLAGAVDADLVPRHAALLALGALTEGALADGQGWRAAVAPWLFGGTLHFALAAAPLFLLAGLLARRVGAVTTLAVAFVPPMLAGLLISSLVPVGVAALGTSLGWAAFGALVVAERRAHQAGAKDGPGWLWWGLVFSLLGLASVMPHAQGGTHMVAALLGAAMVALATRRAGRVAAGAGLALATLALAAGAAFAAENAARPKDALAQDFLRIAPTLANANALNGAAWEVAIDGEASEAELEVAEALSRRSLELSPEMGAYLDTLATVLHRRGHAEEAAKTELRAASTRYNPFYLAQLQRFLRARGAAAGGAALEEDGLREASIGLERIGWGIVMWWPQGTAPIVLTEVHDEDGERLGSTLLVATSSATGSHRYSIPPSLEDHLDAGATLRITWVRGPQADWSPGLTYYPYDPEPDGLP